MRMIASIAGLDARPVRLSTETEITGPTMTSSRGRQRSARRPKPICATDAAIWKSIVSVPAAASDRPSFGISSGSSGA